VAGQHLPLLVFERLGVRDSRFVFLVGLALGVGCTSQAQGPAAHSDDGALQPFAGAAAPSSEAASALPPPVTGGSPLSGEGAPGTGEAVQPTLPLGATPPPAALPGVVVVENELARCAPLCVTTTSTTGVNADGSVNEWGYENATPCVIPGTISARGNQSCNTGEGLPPPRQIPGVVVVDMNVPRCAPLCLIVTSLGADPDGDGWFYENNLSCVVPGTDTARANQPCTTGGALPNSEPRPGLLLADGLGSACRPLCQVVNAPSSPAAPDWGYEQNASCVLPGSPTAGDARQCTFGGPVDPLVPPALPGNKVAPGFFVQAGRLKDAYGGDFVIRGVNNPHIWFDISAQYEAYAALDSIAGYGTNTIRVVWETSGAPSLLREILYRIVQLRMVPMVELHDATSSTSQGDLLAMAQYYARADVRQVLKDFREYALVNIANEWSGNDFRGAYSQAVSYLRANGVPHTLVIDANGFGQNGQAILDNAAALSAADPEHNLVFSVHMYERFTTAGAVDDLLNAASAASIPLLVGEFGWQHGGQNVAWERILTRTNDLRLGYVAWSWWGNGANTAQLDMARDYAGPLTDWGNDVLTGAAGNIQSTSRRASIFE
jgi:mannan endo-1,4-beta-mannosidase